MLATNTSSDTILDNFMMQNIQKMRTLLIFNPRVFAAYSAPQEEASSVGGSI
jgi:hypothetical protein